MSKEQHWPGHEGGPRSGAAHDEQTPEATSHAAADPAARSDQAAGEDGAEPYPRTVEQALDMIDRLREQLATKSAELDQTRDRLLREHADLENYKRRMQREKSESLRYASEQLLRDLLPVLDNLSRAIDAASKAPADEPPAASARVDGLITGVKMVLNQFGETLSRFGVTRVPAAGQPFDPAHHEAVAHVDSDQHAPGVVVDEHASGYRLHDRLLRPAQVTVAKPPRG
jgi:molecular chaperone GrpE